MLFHSNDDDFWNISALTPPKRSKYTEKSEQKQSSYQNKSRNYPLIDAVLVSTNPKTPLSKSKENILSQSQSPKIEHSLLVEYTVDSTFIKSVQIYSWHTIYTFYEQFEEDSRALFKRLTGNRECVITSYFSYMPQFSSLKTDQLKYYLWWRECFIKDIIIPTEFCYVQLFIYELLNIPDLIPPKDGIILLSKLWINYHGDFPKIDRFLSEWIRDYCLIHNVRIPYEYKELLCTYALRATSMSEFYLDEYIECFTQKFKAEKEQGKITDNGILLLALAVRAGISIDIKGLSESNCDFLYMHIICAASCFDSTLSLFNQMQQTVKTLQSYAGAACSYKLKREISLIYKSIKIETECEKLILNIIRYIENSIRGAAGLKSRFSSINLLPEYKSIVNLYLSKANLKPIKKLKNTIKQAKIKASQPASKIAEPTFNETEYHAPALFLAPETANEIERASRLIIDLLGEGNDFEAESEQNVQISPLYKESATFEKYQCDALRALLENNNNAFINVAKSQNLLPDTLAEKINEISLKLIGDIVIEFDGNNFTLFEDYKEDIKNYIKKS